MVTSEQTIKHLSWYIGIVVAKLPFGLEFFFLKKNFHHLATKTKVVQINLREMSFRIWKFCPKIEDMEGGGSHPPNG